MFRLPSFPRCFLSLTTPALRRPLHSSLPKRPVPLPTSTIPDASTFLQAIEAAQDRYPYAEFELKLLGFLKYLHDSLVKPDLMQVEDGQINLHGSMLPDSDSRDMIKRMRLDS